MMTKTPSRVMSVEKMGELKERYMADIVFFDDNINIKKVIIEGKILK